LSSTGRRSISSENLVASHLPVRSSLIGPSKAGGPRFFSVDLGSLLSGAAIFVRRSAEPMSASSGFLFLPCSL